MKNAHQSISSAFSLPAKSQTHSPLFDEVSIVLPDNIVQPTLKKLVIKVQDLCIQPYRYQQTGTGDKDATNNSMHDGTNNVDNEKNQLNKDNEDRQGTSDLFICHAHALLQTLYYTPNADAAVLVAITHETQPKLLLTRRARHLNTHASEVSFAGGKHDLADGNNVVTALREAMEETALPPSKVHIIGQLPMQTSKSGMSVRPIVALIEPDVIYVPELGEIERIFWADLETLINQPTVDYERVFQQDANSTKDSDSPKEADFIKYLTPSWVIDNERVWGLTGRIIASLLEVGFARKVDWYYRPI